MYPQRSTELIRFCDIDLRHASLRGGVDAVDHRFPSRWNQMLDQARVTPDWSCDPSPRLETVTVPYVEALVGPGGIVSCVQDPC
jgi:hypothetical protein